MNSLTLLMLLFVAVSAASGALLAWAIRSRIADREKRNLNDNWQEHMDAQDRSQERLVRQKNSLRKKLGQSRSAETRLGDELEKEREALRNTRNAKRSLLQRIASLDSDLEKSQQKRDRLHSELQDLILRVQQVQVDNESKHASIHNLERQLKEFQQRLIPLQERFKAKDMEATANRLALNVERARLQALESSLSGSHVTLTATPSVAPESSAAIIAESSATEAPDMDGEPSTAYPAHADGGSDDGLAAFNEAFFGNEASTTEHPHAATNNSSEKRPLNGASLPQAERLRSKADDLTRIKGIGKAIHQSLNAIDIYTFEQIAELNDEKIRHIKTKSPGFKGRIRRDRWIEQARSLSEQRE